MSRVVTTTTTTVTMRTVTNRLDNVRQLSAAARLFSFSGCLLAALDAGL
jgi:protein gp37